MEQGSPEWFEARLGKVTASRINDLMAVTKSGPSASRKNYLTQLVVERLTGETSESYTNAAMQWGIDHEPQARAMYEIDTGAIVDEVGFIEHPDLVGAGASPDGLVGDDGLVEIKCPNSATHINTLLKQRIETKYLRQMQFQMACTGRQWCDFVSFDPRLPGTMKLYVQRVPADPDMIKEINEAVSVFLAEVRDQEALLRTRYPQDTAA